jgi:hypothetical protein
MAKFVMSRFKPIDLNFKARVQDVLGEQEVRDVENFSVARRGSAFC